MPHCIFCSSMLSPQTKPEYILLNALGGRVTSRKIVCTECNEAFGSGIDKALAESVGKIRNMMGFKSGSGEYPPGYFYMSENGKVKIGNDGRPSISLKPFTLDEDGLVSNVMFDPSKPDAKGRAIINAAAEQGIDPEELGRKLNNGTITYKESYVAGPVGGYTFDFGGVQGRRSIVKACFELLATQVGALALLDSAFDGVRSFVKSGDMTLVSRKVRHDSRTLPTEPTLTEQYGPFFNHIQVSVSAEGLVVGHFTLYNLISWRIELADNSSLSECYVHLVNDPLDPSRWHCGAAALPRLGFHWLCSPTFEEDLLKERFAKLLCFSSKARQESEIRRIGDEESKNAGIIGHTVVENEAADKFIATLANRSTHLLMKLPYQHTKPTSEKNIQRLQASPTPT